MQACKFTFDDETVYDGFAHGSTWNGFDNIAVSKETLDKIIADLVANNATPDELENFQDITPMENGLYSLGWGFSTSIVRDEPARKTTPIGTRVRLVQEVENYPTILAPVGLIGTLVEISDDGSYWVKLDKHFADLNEWDNQLQIWDHSAENEGRFHPETFIEAVDPHAICRKWVARFGLGFHPDTRGKDYSPPLSAEEIAEYNSDMETLFAIAADPYECEVMAMADAGLKADEMNLLEKAIRNDDIHAALFPIQNALGITSGDVASQHFSGYEPDAETVWQKADPMKRRDMLADYLKTELIWSVP